MLIILSPSCLCHAMSFARPCDALWQLLALPSTTQSLHFSRKGNAVKLVSRSAVQPDMFASGQKVVVLSDGRASIIQHKPEVMGLSLNASHLQKDHPPSSATYGRSSGSKAAIPPPGSLQLLLQTRAGLLASPIPPSTPAAWLLSSSPWLNSITPQLSKVSFSCTSQLCSTTD